MSEIVLDQYYPGGVLKQLGDEIGGVAYNQHAPGGVAKQLSDAAGVEAPLNQYAPGGVVGQIEARIETGAEDSGVPDWVPANALIHIDLVRAFNELDAAYVDGVGVVAVDTLLGNDPNADNIVTTDYDTNNLTADGYAKIGPWGIAFLGAARTLLLDEATVRFQTKQVDEELSASIALTIGAADGNDALEFGIQTGDLKIEIFSWGGDLLISQNDVKNMGLGALNAVALTTTSTRAEGAANGSTVISGSVGEDDRPPGNPFVAATIGSSTGTALQSITFDAPFPNTDGLSELSEVE